MAATSEPRGRDSNLALLKLDRIFGDARDYSPKHSHTRDRCWSFNKTNLPSTPTAEFDVSLPGERLQVVARSPRGCPSKFSAKVTIGRR